MGIDSYEIISKALITSAPTPLDYPKCVCGCTFELHDYANKKGQHQLTAVTCPACNESFSIYDVQDGYKAIPRGQKARLKEENNG